MSRIGKKPIEVPPKVKVDVGSEGAVTVEGPKGKLSWNLPKAVS
jgi:large subunit ribosomal protein L6